ncbi:MAG: hypothetical protein A2Y63_01805 [Candidatus Riflebacteria bacterium RBG_13_59_9]|nr:MAG: hypothetical protein A2Y63_01805 [Candidatus Riflebacteria bacterium RBG_13_59_9]
MALAVLLLTVALLGCGGGKSSPTATHLKSMPASEVNLDQALARLDGLEAPEGVDPDVFAMLKDELRRQLVARGKIVATPSAYTVNDLEEVLPATDPPTITWSSNFFIADGNIDGAVGIADVTPIAFWFGTKPSEVPEAMVADYNRNDMVEIGDITPLAMTFGQDTAGFTIEVCATEVGSFAPLATPVLWTDQLADKNVNGFAVFEYQFATGEVLPPPEMWVRLIPYDAESTPGVACDPIKIDLGAPPVEFVVTDMLIQATGTTNTEPGGDYVGTGFYVAPATGDPTTGEAPANTPVVVVLSDVAYTFKGLPYDFGATLPADLTPEQFDAIMVTLQEHMAYTVVSDETPADPEAWADDATQPPDGLAGTLGPNDAGALLITADMSDSEWTAGSDTFTVDIELALTEDVNAPEIWGFEPPEQPQNKTAMHTVRLDWGADEVGDEMPVQVALYDAATGIMAYTFEPAAVVETTDPPANDGEYTFSRIPIPIDFTTIIQAKLAGVYLEQGVDYVWRVSEDDAGFERRSSLKKPGDTFNLLPPAFFNMNTWPEEEFSVGDAKQPYIYFVPEKPLIRRNPLGHPEGMEPSEFVPDDINAFEDIVKGGGGEQFEIVFGLMGPPPVPDGPLVYYLAGDEPPRTIGEADGMLPISSRQPHLLAGLVAVVPNVPGDVSFGLFMQDGTYLGGVTRLVAAIPIPRNDVVIGDGDFGVRPWGADGSEEIAAFDDKIASQGDNDVVVFTFYNLWLRHDDVPALPQSQQGTHLVLSVMGAPLPDILLRPHILATDFQGGLAYCALDVGADDIWWQNITQPIPMNTYTVTLVNPGAGPGDTYPDNLIIIP